MIVGSGVSSVRSRILFGIAMIGVLFAALAGTAVSGASAKGKKAPRVTVRTTEYGIPRILADNFTGLGYGYGYAIAREQICTLADTYITSRGERSLYFGADAEAPDGNTNLDSDFFWKRIRAEGTVASLLKKKAPTGPKPEIKQAMKGYVAGYNAYLKKTGVKRISDPRCRGKSWVKPITELDAWHRLYQLVLIASQGASLDGIAQAQPPATQASADAPEAADPAEGVTPEDFGEMDDFVGGLGSNAVGLGSDATRSGKGLLLGNPHFPWQGSERFFQAQMTIPGKVNVSGAGLLGVPIALIGHTRNLAWSHTVSTARRFIVFQETLVPGDPTSYLVDGQPRKMKATTVKVKTRGGGTQTRTLYSTIHGPILNSVQRTPLFGWTPTIAYSIGDANAGNFRIANHFFETNQAQSTKQLLNILKRNQGIPWVNTIASDSKGNALYADIGSVPNATDERVAECNTGLGAVAWPTNRLAVFDGQRSECALDKKVAGAAAPGIMSANDQPYEFRKDYVENSNDSYWFTNVKAPLEGFDRIIGEERIAQTERTRLGHKMVNEVLAEGKFTLAKLKAMEYNDRVGSAEILADDLIAYCKANPSMLGSAGPTDVSGGCSVIENWDRRNNLDSRGGLLWSKFIGCAFYGCGDGPSSGLPVYKNEFVFTDPIGTPSGLNTDNPDVPKAFADAVGFFASQGIPLDAKTGDYQYVVRNGKKIPIHGGDYEPVGSFNAIWGPWVPGKGITEVTDGSSFIIAADMRGAKCPEVSTILTYSQSENPKSKHYADQTRLFSKKKWVTDRFCKSQQMKSPGLRVEKFSGGAKAEKRGF
ncbi:MAG TPA: penicillin acylase family protein [Solirubrobacterales bacterium]|nr:penicillin acylase family protein [Solirubrobacterales bacterium]